MLNCDGIDDNKKTIFVLPRIEGVLKPLESVTKNLKAQVFGVSYNYKEPEKTVAEKAQKLLPLVLNKISRDKPFHIVGYSFGAIVTLEVASLLEENGYFGKIILIDAAPDEGLQINLLSRIMSLLLLINFVSENKDKLLKCDNFESRGDTLISLVPSNVPHRPKLDKQAAIALYSRLESVFRYKFNHKKLKSIAHLFKAKYPMVEDAGDNYQSSELCEKPVNVSVFNGNHVTIL